MNKIEARNIVIGLSLAEDGKIKDVAVLENGTPKDVQEILGSPANDQMMVVILDERSTDNWHAVATTILNMELNGEGDDRAIRNCIRMCINSVIVAIQTQ